MNFFCKKQPQKTCIGCRVNFEPEPVRYERYSDYCRNCRKPLEEQEGRKQAVIHWAILNWEKLEAQAIAETNAAKIHVQQSIASAMAYQQSAMNQNSGLSGLGGVFPYGEFK